MTEVAAPWNRPAPHRWHRLRALPWLGGTVVIGFSLIAGMLLADRAADPEVISIPQPIVISAPPAPALEPAPIVTPPSVRLAAPALLAECFGRAEETPSPACAWDNGFPAISGDGKQLAYLEIAGPMGPLDVSVVVLDTATGTQLRKHVIATEQGFDFEHPDDPVRRAKIVQRTAAVQRVLVDGKFRALRALGTHTVAMDLATTGDERGVHAKWTGATLQVIDASSHTELFRHTFSAEAPKRTGAATEECSAWSLAQIEGWWDPESRTVVGEQRYHHGGCMCGETSVRQAFRF